MKPLEEGLQKGDLEGMVLPMLSIDEFQSKIDDRTVIVVAFYSFEEDPAHDLSNFIERSPTQVLDTDVSPAPSKEGYYLTFVEIKRNPQFPQNLINILMEVSRLTSINNWQFTSHLLPKGKVLPINNENLGKYVNLKPKAADLKGKLQEFFQHSSLSDFDLDDGDLTLSRPYGSRTYVFGQIGNTAPQGAFSLSEGHVREANQLQRFLDGPYVVVPFDFGLVVENQISQTFLVLTRTQV